MDNAALERYKHEIGPQTRTRLSRCNLIYHTNITISVQTSPNPPTQPESQISQLPASTYDQHRHILPFTNEPHCNIRDPIFYERKSTNTPQLCHYPAPSPPHRKSPKLASNAILLLSCSSSVLLIFKANLADTYNISKLSNTS